MNYEGGLQSVTVIISSSPMEKRSWMVYPSAAGQHTDAELFATKSSRLDQEEDQIFVIFHTWWSFIWLLICKYAERSKKWIEEQPWGLSDLLHEVSKNRLNFFWITLYFVTSSKRHVYSWTGRISIWLLDFQRPSKLIFVRNRMMKARFSLRYLRSYYYETGVFFRNGLCGKRHDIQKNKHKYRRIAAVSFFLFVPPNFPV